MQQQIYTLVKSRLARLTTNFDLFPFLKQSIPFLMGTFVFLNSFPHITSIKEICFYLSFLFCLALIFSKNARFSFKTPLTIPFLLFVCWIIFTTFFALDRQNSIHDFYSHLIKYIIFYYIMINTMTSQKHLTTLSWLIIISTSAFALGSLLYDYAILRTPITQRFGLSFVQTPTNLVGVVTLSGIILSLHQLFNETHFPRKIFLSFCLLPLFAVTILTQTRSNIIALGAVLILLVPANKKVAIVLIGVTLLMMSITHPPGRWQTKHLLNNERLGLIQIAYEVIKDYPVTGIGFGMHTYGNKLDLADYKAGVSNWLYIMKYPHNMFASTAVRTGVPGFLLFLCILFVSFRMCFQVVRNAQDEFLKKWGYCVLSLLVMFLIKGLFEPVLTHLTEVVFYTILSMIAILWRIHEQTAN